MMKHRDITSIQAANDFLERKFLPHWDEKYTHTPLNDIDLHRPVVGYDLGAILSVQEQRVVTNDYTFQYNGWRYQIDSRDMDARMRRNMITIEYRLNGDIKVRFNDKYIHYIRLQKIIR
jgi:hypothetical protein